MKGGYIMNRVQFRFLLDDGSFIFCWAEPTKDSLRKLILEAEEQYHKKVINIKPDIMSTDFWWAYNFKDGD